SLRSSINSSDSHTPSQSVSLIAGTRTLSSVDIVIVENTEPCARAFSSSEIDSSAHRNATPRPAGGTKPYADWLIALATPRVTTLPTVPLAVRATDRSGRAARRPTD